MHLAVGPLVRLFTRQLYLQIETKNSWYEPMKLGDPARSELLFWRENITKVNGFTFKPRPTTTKIIFTDASAYAYGGFTCERLDEVICSGKFTENEKLTSSTNRELLAVKYVLESFGNILSGESVQVNVNNFSASRILSVGSSKPHLQKIAIEIFQHCTNYDMRISPRWIPRSLNTKADEFSKINDRRLVY